MAAAHPRSTLANSNQERERRRRGRPRHLSTADEDRLAAVRDLDGLSLSELETWCRLEALSISRTTIRTALKRADERLGISAQQSYPSSVAADDSAPAAVASTDKLATPNIESVVLVTPLFAASTAPTAHIAAPSETTTQSPNPADHTYLPGADELVEGLAASYNEHVTQALLNGDRHPIRISWTVPNAGLLDSRARLDLLKRGVPVQEALFGWKPLDDLELLLDMVDASAGAISIDIDREGRLHIYGPVIVPRFITPKLLDQTWSRLSGNPQPAFKLKKRCWYPGAWEYLLDYERGLHTEGGQEYRDKIRSWVRGHVRGIVDYQLKGRDRSSFDRRMPVRYGDRINALDGIVWARGLSVKAFVDQERMLDAGASLDDLLDAVNKAPTIVLEDLLTERASMITQAQKDEVTRRCAEEARRREVYCRYCAELIPPVSESDRASARQPRSKQRTCSHACRQAKHLGRYHPEWLRILTIIGAQMRSSRGAS